MHQIFFYLLLVALPTQLGYHFWPAWATVLGRRVDYLSPTFYFTDGIILLILFTWFFETKNKISFNKKTGFLAAFAAINIYFSSSPAVAAYMWFRVLEYALLGFYIYKTKPKFSNSIYYLSIGVLYSSAITIGQFILQRSVGGPLWFLGERTFSMDTPGIARVDFLGLYKMRAYGTFPHPNVLGGFLAVTLPMIIYQLNQSDQLTQKNKLFYSVSIVLGIIALVLTFSRSAWIAAALGITLVLFQKNKKLFFVSIAVLLSVVFLIIKTVGLQDESVIVRESLNSAAMTMFRASPIVGKGLGNFLVELPGNLPSRQIYFLQPAHNIYLLLLSETGIVGLAIFLWVAWKALKRGNVFLVIILFLGLVDHYPLTLEQGRLLLTILLSSTMAL